MSVRIRFRRMGAKKNPFYRIVVVDSRNPRDGRYIESLGGYNPLSESSKIEIDEDKLFRWLNHGAQPSDPVWNLLNRLGLRNKWEMIKRGEDISTWEPPQPRKPKIKKKAKAAAAAKPEQPVAAEEKAVQPPVEKAETAEVSKTAEEEVEKAQAAVETEKAAKEKVQKQPAEQKEKKEKKQKSAKKAGEPVAERSAKEKETSEGKNTKAEASGKKKAAEDS